MGSEHKAYIFDFNKFSKELKPILELALASGEIESLRNFIISNKSHLCDPYEGEPLADNWEGMIEVKDAEQYGDFALTKYYDPLTDQGLGYFWENIATIISEHSNSSYATILGEPLGTADCYFDPGKLGSFFQDSEHVKYSISVIEQLENIYNGALKDEISSYLKLLKEALIGDKGVYVTF